MSRRSRAARAAMSKTARLESASKRARKILAFAVPAFSTLVRSAVTCCSGPSAVYVLDGDGPQPEILLHCARCVARANPHATEAPTLARATADVWIVNVGGFSFVECSAADACGAMN